ncbi:GNAT family N-acetyltransferase [Embleya sp. NPDC056575]|uniref:GNAT family N-acetyltransferase n=1 Tax=unclassified Embleya TaxID=2699296 RepID=UPI003687B914
MTLTIRPLSGPDELISFERTRALAFGHPPRRSIKPGPTMELDRMHLAVDGDKVVGTTAAAGFELSLPGGSRTACGAIRWVSTLPTHRRCGVLSAMIRHQLDEFRERGETVAVLWASLAPIYARYGFGLATTSVDMTVAPHASFLPDLLDHGPVSYVHGTAEDGHLTKTLAPAYDRLRSERPGLVDRNDAWWRHLTSDAATQWVVHEGPDGIEGYLGYRPEPEGWTDDGPTHRLHVAELIATTPRAELSLWHFALDFDLASTVIAKRRPTDDALPWMLADPRQAQLKPRDGLWLRIVDLAAAMNARSLPWTGDTEIRIRVTDELCPWNAGTWSIGPNSCTRTPDTAHLTLDTADLAACFLGAARLPALTRAGRVTEHRHGAVRQLTRALGSCQAPWAVTWF